MGVLLQSTIPYTFIFLKEEMEPSDMFLTWFLIPFIFMSVLESENVERRGGSGEKEGKEEKEKRKCVGERRGEGRGH